MGNNKFEINVRYILGIITAFILLQSTVVSAWAVFPTHPELTAAAYDSLSRYYKLSLIYKYAVMYKATRPDFDDTGNDFYNHWYNPDLPPNINGLPLENGGAIDKTMIEYAEMVNYLRGNNYQESWNHSGRLSHYVADINQPLHTVKTISPTYPWGYDPYAIPACLGGLWSLHTCAEVSLGFSIEDLWGSGRLKTSIEEVSTLDGYLIGKATISHNKVSGFVSEYENFWTKYKGCKFGADLDCLETNFPTAVSQAREAVKSIASIWYKALSEAKLSDREPKTPPGNDTKPKPRPPGITIFTEDFERGIANWRKEGCAMHTTLCNLTWSFEKFVSEFSSLKIRNIVCAATVTQTVRATRSFAEVNPGEIHFEVYVQGSLDAQPRDGFRPILRLTRGNLTIYQSYYYSVKKNYSKFGFEPDKLSPYYRLDNWTKFDLVYYYNGTAHLYIHDQLVAVKTGLPKNYTFSNVWLINEGHSDCHQIVTYFDDVKVWYRAKGEL